MRAYFFGNMYIASIQHGIQAQHTTAELFRKYKTASTQFDILASWADLHKTSILLNGGYSATLRELIGRFSSRHNPYPWTYFNESEEAADSLLTCVGIILPAKIYDTASEMRKNPDIIEEINKYGVFPGPEGNLEFSKWEFELCKELNNYGLAS